MSCGYKRVEWWRVYGAEVGGWWEGGGVGGRGDYVVGMGGEGVWMGVSWGEGVVTVVICREGGRKVVICAGKG